MYTASNTQMDKLVDAGCDQTHPDIDQTVYMDA